MNDTNATHAVEVEQVGEEAAKVKLVPAKHRHLKPEDTITQPLIEQVLLVNRANNSADLRLYILRRMGYTPATYDRMVRRVIRWKANRALTGHRMPSHIRLMVVAMEIVERSIAEFNKPKEDLGIVAKAMNGAKQLAKDFASEVKAQQV